jgi:hypothetical protein
MSRKMIIFAKWGGGLHFCKNDHFSAHFQSSFLKNERKMKTENEAKMAEKWLP